MKNVKLVSVQEWDNLVEDTYGRPYSFQQQDGCKERGTFQFNVPYGSKEDFPNDTIPEKVNGPQMGVSFKAWLARNPNKPVDNEYTDNDGEEAWRIRMFWERNFYPCIDMVINDLHKQGLLEKGEYVIDIDW